MRFKDFIENGQARKASPDISLAKSLVATAEMDARFLASLEINEFSARKITANYYDVLRSIVEAISAIDGYKIYSHEAFTSFLREKGEEMIAEKFDRFRRIRNGINYYGNNISAEEARENAAEIVKLIKALKTKYLGSHSLR